MKKRKRKQVLQLPLNASKIKDSAASDLIPDHLCGRTSQRFQSVPPSSESADANANLSPVTLSEEGPYFVNLTKNISLECIFI